jgi:hypothetical protein
MTKNEYWREALDAAMADAGIYLVLTDEQAKAIADALISSADNQSLAFYEPPAPRAKPAPCAQCAEYTEALKQARLVIKNILKVRSDKDFAISPDGSVKIL